MIRLILQDLARYRMRQITSDFYATHKKSVRAYERGMMTAREFGASLHSYVEREIQL